MSRRQHNWLRFGALALIVGLQLLPRAPRGTASVTVATASAQGPRDTSLHPATPTTIAASTATRTTELAIAE